jgi:predicted Zn-dependent protease with MMP-like domain
VSFTVTPEAFEALVQLALRRIPGRFRREMQNLAIVVERAPTRERLAEVGVTPPDTLYGLYEGIPLPERTSGMAVEHPDRITLFSGPILADAVDIDDAEIIVAETLIHECGHYFGLSEDEIEAIEEEYWENRDSQTPE